MPKKLLLEDDDGNIIDLHTETNNKKKLKTEDLGKEFEMALCLLYETPYQGNFKYSMEKAEKLKVKLENLKKVFPYKLLHTAKNGSRYDFTGEELQEIKLSAKTTKNKSSFKICPQVIGQPTKKKFCEHFGLDSLMTNQEIKLYIQTNIEKLLDEYFKYTFDCPIIFYNEANNLLWLIKKHTNIDWDNCIIKFGHVERDKEWNESTSIIINGYSMGEFQIHNHRDNIKFRWNLYNLIYCFHHGQNEKYFEIYNLMLPPHMCEMLKLEFGINETYFKL